MPTINSSLIPLVTPGSVFPTLTENTSLAIRWIVATDPHFYEVYNRPMADITVRQLIIAKSLDQLGLRLSAQGNFPFLNPATVDVATTTVSLPVSWIWDMHVTVKDNWENLRLALIQRFAGSNNVTTGEFTGSMRLVFTANEVGSTSEVGLFYVDYEIDSQLSWQVKKIRPCTVSEYPNPIPSNQTSAISGFVVFRTLDTSEHSDFFNALAPPLEVTASTDPTTIDYEISDTVAGGTDVTGDFSFANMSHGYGLLVPSAYNLIPPIGTDELSVLAAINYPWRNGTSLVSTDKKSTVPSLLFSQFTMTAPMGERSIGLEENFPVYLTRIRRLNDASTSLQFIFSTNNTIFGSTSDEFIDFAAMTLEKGLFGSNAGPGTVIEITPFQNLRNNADVSSELFTQNFGSGFVILSSEWATNTAIEDFFDSFSSIVDEPAERYFNAQLNEFALQRSPYNVPTIGEAAALAGSTSRRKKPIHPSDKNRYVVEADQGLGEAVDFREVDGFESNSDIDPVAYRGSLLTQKFTLIVNTANTAKFSYEGDILPRIKHLLGRPPIHGDVWFDGTSFKQYDQISNAWIG